MRVGRGANTQLPFVLFDSVLIHSASKPGGLLARTQGNAIVEIRSPNPQDSWLRGIGLHVLGVWN